MCARFFVRSLKPQNCTSRCSLRWWLTNRPLLRTISSRYRCSSACELEFSGIAHIAGTSVPFLSLTSSSLPHTSPFLSVAAQTNNHTKPAHHGCRQEQGLCCPPHHRPLHHPTAQARPAHHVPNLFTFFLLFFKPALLLMVYGAI